MMPFRTFGLNEPQALLPVLLSVPHAGRDYGTDLLVDARVSRVTLGLLEDPLVDRLVEPAIAAGAAAVVALAPRALIDLNRSLDDLDPAMVSPPADRSASHRASAGLGLIPSRLAGHGALWRHPMSAAEVQRRIDAVHRPYHDAIADALVAIRARFGVAILLDCHSMPARTRSVPGIVLGDRHGSSCADWLARTVADVCDARAIRTARNDPYAGGEIVRRHGAPDHGIHALQIEFDRRLYLAHNARDAGSGFVRIAQLLVDIVAQVGRVAAAPIGLAAE